MRAHFFFFLFFISLQGLYAQPQAREHYLSGGVNAGLFGWAPAPQTKLSGSQHYMRALNGVVGSVIDDQGRSRFSLLANSTVGFTGSYQWRNNGYQSYTAVFAEVQRNRNCYSYDPPFTFAVQGDTFGGWIQTDRYLRYGVGLEQMWARSSNTVADGEAFFYLRASFSQTNFHRNFDRRLSLGYTENWRENGRGMVSRIVAYNPRSWMVSAEFGIRTFAFDRSSMLDFGAAVHVPFQHTYTEQYEFFENNASTGKGELKYLGASLLLNLRYSFNLKLPAHEPDTTSETPPPVLVQTPVDTAGMQIVVQGQMLVTTEEVEIVVWDKNEVDGDRITLYLNGEVVVHDLTLRRRKKKFKVKLQPGKNYLVMHAENLGTKPPNTAAVEIRTKGKRRNVTLVSDKEKSGAIEIIRKP